MCQRYSWGEKTVNGKIVVIIVTAKEIYHTEQGKRTREHCNNDPTEYWGHSAIAFYHGIDPLIIRHRECEGFLTPDNFPAELVAAIKTGDMAEFGVTESMVAGLLSQKGQKRYTSECKAYANWLKACANWQKADAEWRKADAEWRKADAEWRKADAEWRKADAEWQKADAEWQKADAEWQKADAAIFWAVFEDVKYRAGVWE